MTCDDYQMAADQLAAGAPAPITAGDLEAHVAACAGCAAYLAVSRKVSDTMDHALSLGPAPLDLAVMRGKLAARRHEIRRGVWTGSLFWVAYMTVVYSRDSSSLLHAAITAAIYDPAMSIRRRPRRRQPGARRGRRPHRGGRRLADADRRRGAARRRP